MEHRGRVDEVEIEGGLRGRRASAAGGDGFEKRLEPFPLRPQVRPPERGASAENGSRGIDRDGGVSGSFSLRLLTAWASVRCPATRSEASGAGRELTACGRLTPSRRRVLRRGAGGWPLPVRHRTGKIREALRRAPRRCS